MARSRRHPIRLASWVDRPAAAGPGRGDPAGLRSRRAQSRFLEKSTLSLRGDRLRLSAEPDWVILPPIRNLFATAREIELEAIGIAGFGEEGHEGLGPHPATGKGAMNEKQRRAIGLARRQAGENLQAVDFFGFYHCNSFVG